ncbi:DUF4403 family protein [Chryseobacterium sp. POL2]|uniref:DUF4403 family protein n=1 Tax=Chryseobacterium sp. POL2 TaxID=2713414 RepID=UPI0013E1B5F6|nr:DUF4403 family protein [Chryseobacterium sp. POL2]QIG89577.1 DUF4403 family protein [Chryseobacterium sp. POL2]
MKYFFSWLFSLSFLWAFNQNSEVNAIDLPKIPSNISLPIEIPISEIEHLVNQSVTGTIYEDKSFTDNNNDQFKVKVNKQSNIRIKALTNNRLMISVPLQIWAEKGYGTMGVYVYKDTSFNLVMNFISSISTNPDWTLTTSTQSAGFVWKDKPVLDYGKVKIPIASFVESTLKEQQNKFTSVIDTQIKSSFKLQPYLVLAWNQFAKPINISQEYNTWLKITPQKTYLKPIEVFADKIKTNVGLALVSETFVGLVPSASALVKQVPNYISKSDISDDFVLQTTTNISFHQATILAEQQFLNKEIELGSPSRKVKVEAISVFPDKDEIVLEIRTSGYVNGTSTVKGKPAYDEANQKIVLSDTDFNLKTKNVFQKAVTVLFEGKIRKMLEQEYGIPMQDMIASSKESIKESFNKEYFPGLKLAGQVVDLKPSQFILTLTYITAVVDTKAKLQLVISGLNF